MKAPSPALALIMALAPFAMRAAAEQAAMVAMPLTHREQAEALGHLTKSDKADWMREQVRKSRYGQRGLDSIFKNFEDGHYFDPSVPGVTKNIIALNSLSPQQEKGAVRTLLFATVIDNDPRFELVAVDRPVTAPYGRTDKDLWFRHKQTGQRCRVEVKDAKPTSQRADLERIKCQIDKMAAEYRRTGELQAWANRRRTIPAVLDYAKRNGVPVYERTRQSDFGQILDDFDQRSFTTAGARLAGGGIGVGLGVLLLYTSGEALFADIESTSNDPAHALGTAEHASLFVTGSGSTTYGVGRLGPLLTTEEGSLETLGKLTKWGGKLGFYGAIASEGIAVAIDVTRWEHMTEGQKRVALLRHGSSALAIFVFSPIPLSKHPWVAVPALALSGIGYVSAYFVEKYYAGLEEEQKQQVRKCTYEYYGLTL
jgi:hypothetical protein